MQPGDVSKIAYLAPEIPALSATFVYEELLGIERRGIQVTSISVRPPTNQAKDQAELAKRTNYIYSGSQVKLVLLNLIRLPSFGIRALIALKQLSADMRECGFHRLVSWKLAYQFLAAIRLAQILQKDGCTHLHVHFAHTPSQIAMYASTLTGIPFTIMAHANDIFERGLLLLRKAERASRMLTISEHNLRFLQGIGIPQSQLAIVRCGVSFPIKPKPFDAEKRGGRRFRIGSLGRMVEKKGFDILSLAVAELAKSGRSIELCIAGDGPLRSALDQLIRKLGINAITRFEGSIPHDQVADWMKKLDIFVLACKKDKNGDMDGIPVVLMEAMSQSVPVVSTRLSGIPELVIHEKTGLLANPEDYFDLAHQIDRLIQSESLYQKIATEARKHVTNEFGQSTNLDRLIEHFRIASFRKSAERCVTRVKYE